MSKSAVEKPQFWLFKSEPDAYSFEDLVNDGKTYWDGVRNYQARNLLRDEIKKGDRVLFYHSRSKPMCIAGTATVTKGGYPDPTQFDPSSKYHDPSAEPDAPRWYVVDIVPDKTFDPPVYRDDLKGVPQLKDMMLLKKGSRLSVQPVQPKEWEFIMKMVVR